MKLLKFPDPSTKKFGPKRVTKKNKGPEAPGQLDLFYSGKIVPLHQHSTFEEALILDNQGDKNAAKKLYLKAIENGESLADTYCNLGILESQDENFIQAIDALSLSLKHDPRHFEAHYNLANVYAEVGNFVLAKIHYNLSITIEPAFANSYFNLALTLACIREFKEAVNVLNRYRQLTPREEHKPADELISKLKSRFLG